MSAPDDSSPIAKRRLAQEIEIAAVIGLEYLVAVEPCVAACRTRRARCAAAAELGSVDEEVETTLGDAEADAVAVAHQAERAAGGGVRRDVQHDRAVGGA